MQLCYETSRICSICLSGNSNENGAQETVYLSCYKEGCQAEFHPECVRELFRSNFAACPVCRRGVTNTVTSNREKTDQEIRQLSSAIIDLKNMVQHNISEIDAAKNKFDNHSNDVNLLSGLVQEMSIRLQRNRAMSDYKSSTPQRDRSRTPRRNDVRI